MTPCPKCAGDNTRCYGESTHTRYLPDNGEYDGDYIVAFYVCDDCEHDWIVADDAIEDDDDAINYEMSSRYRPA